MTERFMKYVFNSPVEIQDFIFNIMSSRNVIELKKGNGKHYKDVFYRLGYSYFIQRGYNELKCTKKPITYKYIIDKIVNDSKIYFNLHICPNINDLSSKNFKVLKDNNYDNETIINIYADANKVFGIFIDCVEIDNTQDDIKEITVLNAIASNLDNIDKKVRKLLKVPTSPIGATPIDLFNFWCFDVPLNRDED